MKAKAKQPAQRRNRRQVVSTSVPQPKEEIQRKGKEKIAIPDDQQPEHNVNVDEVVLIAYGTKQIPLRVPNRGNDKFNAPLFGAMVQSGFSQVYEDQSLSDVTLITGPHKIQVHRLVLTVWSELFTRMLEEEDQKRKDGTATKPDDEEERHLELVVDIPPEDYTNFENMVKFMYTGATDFIDESNVLPLLSLSNFFGIHALKEECGTMLGELVDEDNLSFFLDIANRYNCETLFSACGEQLASRFEDLWEDAALDGMSVKVWREMIQSDALKVTSEEDLFEIILAFSNSERFTGPGQEESICSPTNEKSEKEKNKKGKGKTAETATSATADSSQKKPKRQLNDLSRDEVLNQLLPGVRYPCMSAQFLLERVDTEPSIQHLPVVHELLHEAFKFKVYSASIPKSPRLRMRIGFSFDKKICSSFISISESGLEAKLTSSSGWQSVQVSERMTLRHNYIQWKVSGNNLMLGVVSGTLTHTTGYAGQTVNGWTYYSQGGLYHNNATPTTGQTYMTGDVIGCAVDFPAGKIQFYKNGAASCVLSGLPTWDPVKDANREMPTIYPVACFSQINSSAVIQRHAYEPGTERGRKTAAATTSPERKRTTKLKDEVGRVVRRKNVVRNDPTVVHGMRRFLKW